MSSSTESANPITNLLNSISSYDGNVLLAAVISLLLVILFVLILHIYARWFLSQARQRRQSSMSVSHVLRPTARFHHFHSFTFETTTSSNSTLSCSPSKGLDSSIISSIPLFVYSSNNDEYNCKHGLDCVICLSGFEENDVGRNLPKCGHVFHVECIDMWLHSHSSCPICRAPVVITDTSRININVGELRLEMVSSDDLEVDDDHDHEVNGDQSRLEIVISDVPNSDDNVGVSEDDSLSSASSSMGFSSSLGCSLKRMLSKNRSERKVFPSSNHVTEMEA